MPDIVEIHLCQDSFGFWFIVFEHNDGHLELFQHADAEDSSTKDAVRMAERYNVSIVKEKPHRTDTEERGYRPPRPRKARVK